MMPVPQPMSSTSRPEGSSLRRREIICEVVAWWPVPNDICGLMVMRYSASGTSLWKVPAITQRPSTTSGWK